MLFSHDNVWCTICSSCHLGFIFAWTIDTHLTSRSHVLESSIRSFLLLLLNKGLPSVGAVVSCWVWTLCVGFAVLHKFFDFIFSIGMCHGYPSNFESIRDFIFSSLPYFSWDVASVFQNILHHVHIVTRVDTSLLQVSYSTFVIFISWAESS